MVIVYTYIGVAIFMKRKLWEMECSRLALEAHVIEAIEFIV